MTKYYFPLPGPRREISSPKLTRPDWTQGVLRDSSMFWLDKNENSDPALAKVTSKVLAEVPTEALYSYPESGPLYRKLAAHLGVKPSNLLFSAGSDGAIRSVFEAYISPGDVVIHTHPTFAMYSIYSLMYGADVRSVEYSESNNGPKLPAEKLIANIKANNPKLVCLPNPDSPTGTVIYPDELRSVVEAAGEVGALMLIDEAYYPFYEDTVLSWINEYPHLIVTRSTGKAWGLAGFRLGYAATSPEVAEILHKVRPMYETNTIVLYVMERLLDLHDEMLASVRRLVTGKNEFLKAMQGLGFRTLESHGNFLHVAFGNHSEKVHEGLSEIVYYREDFNVPCLKGFSRFSATTVERFEIIAERIRQVMKEN